MFCRVILKPAAVILKLLEEYPLEAGRKCFKCISPAVTRMLLHSISISRHQKLKQSIAKDAGKKCEKPESCGKYGS